MSRDPTLDPSWYEITRFRPAKQDFETLLTLLKHHHWEVRWNAAREFFFRRDAHALDALVDLLKNDPSGNVQIMASRALGALHEDGEVIPLYASVDDHSQETRIRVALSRIEELGVEVTEKEDVYKLLIPHTLSDRSYIEIGYLMAQLTKIPFPEKYSPLAGVSSQTVPILSNPCVEFRGSYPAYLKFLVYWQR